MANTHTVVKGDTLWSIAQRYLGSGSLYRQLAAINNISNPDLIYVGQVIKLSEDGGSSSSSSSTSSNSNAPTINQFGLQSNADNTLFATWSWSKSNTESYKVSWTYNTGDGVWFSGSNSTITVDEDDPSISRQSTYNIPNNAQQVRFKVKPISKTYTKNNKETKYWEAEWSSVKTYTDSTPLTAPPTPNVEIDKYKLTATLDNLSVNGTGIQFEIVKDNSSTVFNTGKATIVTRHASYSCTVDPGGEYKVRCRTYNGSQYSDWSDYSGNVDTMPATPKGITVIRATSATSVYLEWAASNTATTYDIEYTTKKNYFDTTDQTTKVSSIEFTKYEFIGLESGSEYFFRVRAVNEKGESSWSEIRSVIIGKKPAAPTTWSSSTTVIAGEPLTLYWVHNSEDGSKQKYAYLEIIVDGEEYTDLIENTSSEDDEDEYTTSSYPLDTSRYVEGIHIEWRVQTSGVTNVFGDWSVQRSIDIYAPPTLELNMRDALGSSIRTLTSFPFYVSALAGPATQLPIGYHVVVTANESYETVDNVGNVKMVNAGDHIYSKYFDINTSLLIEMSANNIDLENNVNYTITCTASMNSGLTAETSIDFTVAWTELSYIPNAEIGIDEDSLTAYIRPYCENRVVKKNRVTRTSGIYTLTSETLGAVWGEVVPGAKTTTGEIVYSGMTASGEEVYYCEVEEVTAVNDVLLSVYRREFDGSFTELATGLDSSKSTTITDPHPALDYARYRIVAIAKDTGSVSYYDAPGYPIGGKAVIVQWDEDWTYFDVTEENALEQPPWSGSLLKLPYNIDVSDNHKADVQLIEYIGREYPISYYGTQLGHSSTWNVSIDKRDEETLYALRRLARWMGDVYVREPSGSGYWANITVSFSQKHCDTTIPVTLDIVRVEGGV